MTNDEVVRWHHGLSGEEFDQAPGDGEGQSSQTGYSSWGCKDLDTTEQQQIYWKTDAKLSLQYCSHLM